MTGTEDFLANYADWIVGGLLVLVYARGRFRTPKTNVGTTTYYRFTLAAWSYYATAFLLFFFLSNVLREAPDFARAFGLSAEVAGEGFESLSSPLLAALLMTVMLPNIAVLSRVDEWLLRRFRDIGNIPWEIRKWRDQLVANEPEIPPQARQDMLKALGHDPRFLPFTPDNLNFIPGDTPSYHLTKVMYLMGVLDELRDRDHGEYARVLEEFSEDYVAIKAQFERALVAGARCLEVTAKAEEGARAEEREGASSQAVAECKLHFRERCDELYREMCLLLARAVLYKERTQRGRVATLERYGFSVSEDGGAPSPLDANQILGISSIVFLILGLGAIAIGMRGTPQEVMFRSIMISAIFGAAVVCALWPKSWAIATHTGGRSRPMVSYLLSGILAAACAAGISVLFKSIAMNSTLEAVRNLAISYPWFLMSFATAFGLAGLADNWGGKSEREPIWGRYAEGVALAAGLTLTFLLVRAMLMAIPSPHVPSLQVASVAAAIGFVLGVLVPHWYRRHHITQPERSTEPEPLPPMDLVTPDRRGG